MNIKNLANFVILLPIFWIFSGYLVISGGDKKFVALVLVALLTSCFYYKFKIIRENYNQYLLALLITSIIYGSILDLTVGFSSGEIRTLIAALLYFLILPKKLISKKILVSLLMIASILSLLLLSYNHFYLDIPRAIVIYNPIPYATVLCVFSILCLYLIIFENKKILILSYIFFVTSIFLTLTRGAIVSVLIVSIGMLLYKLLSSGITKKSLLFSLLTLITMVFFSYNSIEHRVIQTKNEINRIKSGDLNTSIGLRFQYWDAALKLIPKNPLYGLGDNHTKHLKELSDQNLISKSFIQHLPLHYHNQYLDKLVKTGVIGFFLFLLLQMSPFLGMKINKSNPSYKVLTTSMVSTFILTSLTDTPFSQSVSFCPIIIIIYIVIHWKYLNSSDDIDEKLPLR